MYGRFRRSWIGSENQRPACLVERDCVIKPTRNYHFRARALKSDLSQQRDGDIFVAIPYYQTFRQHALDIATSIGDIIVSYRLASLFGSRYMPLVSVVCLLDVMVF